MYLYMTVGLMLIHHCSSSLVLGYCVSLFDHLLVEAFVCESSPVFAMLCVVRSTWRRSTATRRSTAVTRLAANSSPTRHKHLPPT